jgi:hypothetical protein
MPKKDNMTTMSFSELSSFIQCPYKHNLEYVKGLIKDKPESIYLSYGKALHSGAEQLFKTKDVKEAQNVFEKQFTFDVDKYKFSDSDDFLKAGLIILSKLIYEKFFINEEFLYSELELLHNIRDDIYFKGYIDLLTLDAKTGILYISDFKTTKNGWHSSKKDDILTKMQLLLYKIFLLQNKNWKKNFNINNIKCRFILLISNKKAIEVEEVDESDYAIEKTSELFYSVIDSLYKYSDSEIWKFKVKNDFNCKFCQFNKTDHCKTIKMQEGFKLVTNNIMPMITENYDATLNNKLILPWRDGIGLTNASENKNYIEDLKAMVANFK